MKALVTLLLILGLASTDALAQRRNPEFIQYEWKVIRVLDGDTVEFEAPWVPPPIRQRIALRIYGVDTPEGGRRARCTQESARAQAASEFTRRAIANSRTVRAAITDWDKYGGRILGDVILDNGVSLRSLLIRNGHAREYFGDTKQSWC
jgi:endonuclease YncB( thermonuclease family)